MHLIYLDILCTESDIYWRKQNWIFTFQTIFSAKLPDKLHCLQDYLKLVKQRKVLLNSVWCKAWLVLMIIFLKPPCGKRLWGPHKLSGKKRYWRYLENTTTAHSLKNETEILNNREPLSDGFEQDSTATLCLKIFLENM